MTINSSPLARVGAALAEMAAGRTLSDQELRQHAKDCGFLMESAYSRFQRFAEVAAREEALLWLDRRNEALKQLQARGTSLGEDDAAGWFASDAAHTTSRAA